MDKLFLRSLGIELKMPRWKAYLMLLGFAVGGVVTFYFLYLLLWIVATLIFNN